MQKDLYVLICFHDAVWPELIASMGRVTEMRPPACAEEAEEARLSLLKSDSVIKPTDLEGTVWFPGTTGWGQHF